MEFVKIASNTVVFLQLPMYAWGKGLFILPFAYFGLASDWSAPLYCQYQQNGMLIISPEIVSVGKMFQNVMAFNMTWKLTLQETMDLFKLIKLYGVFCDGKAWMPFHATVQEECIRS